MTSRSLLRLAAAVVLPLALVRTAAAQSARTYVVDSADNRILSVTFDGADPVAVNADAGARRRLRGLAVLDDLMGARLIATDTKAGKVLLYPPPLAGVVGTVIGAVPSPDGPSLDAAGSVFVVGSTSSHEGDDGNDSARHRSGGSWHDRDACTRLSVWKIPRNAAGAYRPPVAIDARVPGNVLAGTAVVPFRADVSRAGDLLVLAKSPARIWRYPGGRPCANPHACSQAERKQLVGPDAFGDDEPTGFAFAPDRSLLVVTSAGRIRRFDANGAPLPDFASFDGEGPFGIAVGPQGGAVRAFVTDKHNGRVLRFRFGADGRAEPGFDHAGDLDAPVGVGTTTRNSVSVPASAGEEPVHVAPSDLADVEFEEVTLGGHMGARVVLFADPRESDEGFVGGELPLDSIDAAFGDVVIPSYVRAFPTTSGVPTFILIQMDTTAHFAGAAELHGLEERVLGYDPVCDSPSQRAMEGRWFSASETAPPKSEPPDPESPQFADITTGCGSMIGHRDRFSLFLVARDTRALDGPGKVSAASACSASSGIVDCKLNRLGRVLASAGRCLTSHTRRRLNADLSAAVKDFDRGRYEGAISKMESFLDATGNEAAFGACAGNLRGNLEARALSALFMLRKIPHQDDDGGDDGDDGDHHHHDDRKGRR